MSKTFKHNGKIGDVIFSLPAIRELGGGILYIPEDTPDECKGMYMALKDLLLLQPFIKEVREYPSGYGYMELAPGIHIDIDLDRARLQPKKGLVHIVKRYLDAFNINLKNWQEPWLVIDDVPTGITAPYSVINFTGRHRENERGEKSGVDWQKVLKSIQGQVYFIGLPHEYEIFTKEVGYVEYFPTKNMLELARVIRDSIALYCNQSSALALAQSLGKRYYLDVKPGKRNCLLYTNNEFILQ